MARAELESVFCRLDIVYNILGVGSSPCYFSMCWGLQEPFRAECQSLAVDEKRSSFEVQVDGDKYRCGSEGVADNEDLHNFFVRFNFQLLRAVAEKITLMLIFEW